MAAKQVMTVFRGDSFEGVINFNSTDAAGEVDDYAIPSGATISINFPGTSSTVSLTSGGGEVTFVAGEAKCSFVGPSSKSPNLKVSSADTDLQTVEAVVTKLDGTVKTFQKTKLLLVKDRANA